MPSSSDQPRSFHTTQWSLVVAAGRRASPEGAVALEALCRQYWYPLYAFARRRVGRVEEARDLTQAFFARLLEKDALARVDESRGRFRAFLLTAFQNFLTNEGARARAEKRGGGHAPLPLDFTWGDDRYRREPADPWTPERLYDRQWTLLLLDQVFAQLRARYEAQGKLALFERLKGTLTGPAAASHADAARVLGMTEGAVKVAAHRLRKAYRELLQAAVAQTVADPAEVRDELLALFRSLDP